MKYLIDTHTAIWYFEGNSQISTTARQLIENPDNQIFYSVITLWEIAIKLNLKKLELAQDFKAFCNNFELLSFEKLELSEDFLSNYTTLPIYGNHRDPFDRMLVAVALTLNFPIISVDAKFDLYTIINRVW
jgi:PIN domain nuclease of toxin-antitoxin system